MSRMCPGADQSVDLLAINGLRTCLRAGGPCRTDLVAAVLGLADLLRGLSGFSNVRSIASSCGPSRTLAASSTKSRRNALRVGSVETRHLVILRECCRLDEPRLARPVCRIRSSSAPRYRSADSRANRGRRRAELRRVCHARIMDLPVALFVVGLAVLLGWSLAVGISRGAHWSACKKLPAPRRRGCREARPKGH